MTDTVDRAERALRDALAERAHDATFTPLDPDAVRAAASGAGPQERRRSVSKGVVPEERRRSVSKGWLALAAAAAVVIVAVPVGVQVFSRGGIMSAAPAPAPAAAPQAADKAAGGAEAGQPGAPVASAALAPLLPGFRYASFADVVVQVPKAWGYDRALGPDWCADGAGVARLASDPAQPFVDVRPQGRVVRSIGCAGDVPSPRQTMHLTWSYATSPLGAPGDDAVPTADGWVRVRRPVGAVVLTVVAPLSQRALAEQILGTAQQVAVDHNGCATVAPRTPVSPDARPRPVVAADAVGEPVVACQYDDLTRTSANLVASAALAPDVALAGRLLGGGPVVARTPGTCLQDDRGATLVVVRWPNLGAEIWVTVPGCDPATVDDGRTVVAASTAACGEVFRLPLALPDAGQAGDACFAARPSR